MDKYVISNELIKDTFIGKEDHGFLTAGLSLSGERGVQGYGNFILGNGSTSSFVGKGLAADFIWACLTIAKVEKWDNLRGRHLRALRKEYGGSILAIGDIIEDRWTTITKDSSMLIGCLALVLEERQIQ